MTSLRLFFSALMLTCAFAGNAVAQDAPMQRFVIEREIPGAGQMTAQQLREAAAKSNQVLREMGPDIQWVQSYVTGDKLYCVYNARSADIIKKHAERSGFPANRVSPVSSVIDPTTATTSASAKR